MQILPLWWIVEALVLFLAAAVNVLASYVAILLLIRVRRIDAEVRKLEGAILSLSIINSARCPEGRPCQR